VRHPRPSFRASSLPGLVPLVIIQARWLTDYATNWVVGAHVVNLTVTE
jgi:hypothetical protein